MRNDYLEIEYITYSFGKTFSIIDEFMLTDITGYEITENTITITYVERLPRGLDHYFIRFNIADEKVSPIQSCYTLTDKQAKKLIKILKDNIEPAVNFSVRQEEK